MRLVVLVVVASAVLVTRGGAFKLYDGYYNSLFRPVVEQSFKAKVETLGAVLKRHVQQLRSTENRQVDLVFLVDSSASVGGVDFREEIKFVRKLLADFTVDLNTTRVAIVTFSSREKVVRQVDHLTRPHRDHHKCSLLTEEIPRIKYVGGGTYTLGAFLEAKRVLRAARPDAVKAVFLITDGFSNGGDPRPEARRLRQQGVKIFTFGIRNGNVRELWEMASEPRNETCYVLNSFEEFEALARRALHSDLHSGTYVPQSGKKCSRLCDDEGYCCHDNSTCMCGTHTGKYECLCKPGFYGNGLGKDGCKACPSGTYKNYTGSGDVTACSACPDENQETPPGATLVHECKCKRGFRNFNSSECTVFRCPELQEPDNGYFVNNQCNNVFNAACGLRCRPGYELRGSGLRICQEDGAWSGQDTMCVLKTCPALPSPKNGHMVCTTDDFRFPTVCRFTCQAGYQLLGSRKRSCLAIAFWTGIAARCREITCPPIAELRDGYVQPTLCTEGEVPFGTTCQLSCVRGYRLRGPAAKQCTPDGTWSAVSREPNQCVDKTPPFIQCPENIEITADPENVTTEVTWGVPVAVDNSGFIPVLTSDPAVVPPARFPIGFTVVTYRAEDLSGNVAKCKFYILVDDKTPPRIDKCFSPEPVVWAEGQGNVTWEEPLFSDNSGLPVHVESSHSPGELFSQGTTTVTYTAVDGNGNNNTCLIEVEVTSHPCQYPDPPVNGERACRESEEGAHCVLSCRSGYAFVSPPPDEYFCAYDNVWTPADHLPFPDCAAQHISNEVLQPASITLTGDLSCAEHTLLNRVEQNIEAKVNDKVSPRLCVMVSSLCAEDIACDMAEVHTTCDEQHEDFNKISLVPQRLRRSADQGAQRRRQPTASLKFEFTLEGVTWLALGSYVPPAVTWLALGSYVPSGVTWLALGSYVPPGVTWLALGSYVPSGVTWLALGSYVPPGVTWLALGSYVPPGVTWLALGSYVPPGVTWLALGSYVPSGVTWLALGSYVPSGVTWLALGSYVPSGVTWLALGSYVPSGVTWLALGSYVPPGVTWLALGSYVPSGVTWLALGSYVPPGVTWLALGSYVPSGVTWLALGSYVPSGVTWLALGSYVPSGTVKRSGSGQEASRRQEELSRSMKALLHDLQTHAKEGHFDLYLAGRWLRFSDMDFDDRRQRKSCPQGAILLDDSCVLCPVGMFFNVVSHRCHSCPQGTYQHREGLLACMVCPEKTNTSSQNARSEQDCRAQCLPGTISPTGLERCETCQTGSFQPRYAQLACIPCPDGSTTLRRGARGKEQCKERCGAGRVSRSGLWPCYPCPHGTYQPEGGQTGCIKCPHEADTDRRAATSLTHCIGYLEIQSDDAGVPQSQQPQLLDANECFSKPCQNGGTCLPRDDGLFDCQCSPGFEGVFCETEVNQCKAEPCLNGGTCSPLPGAYQCDCPPGFEGKKCERDLDDCVSSPCQNGGTCVDGPNSFTCNCPNGFQGATCDSDINDCEDQPCLNGGTCEDDVSGFRCVCPEGFTGTTCEIETDECLSAPCSNGGTCVDEPSDFRCECAGGYTGKHCEKDVNECASDPCQHGAKCEDLVNAYKCHCDQGFTGQNCESGAPRGLSCTSMTVGAPRGPSGCGAPL
ncbi:hypothetical protein ACOMHN_039118 [Nucella lapillus]